MNIAGLDLSITATGLAYADGSVRTIAPRRAGDARLVEIRDEIRASLEFGGADLVVIEGPVLRSSAAIALAMLHGTVRTELWDLGIPYVLLPPATLKKFATGKGTASKPDMAVAAFKRAGLEFADDNQCDAAWLRWAGLCALELPLPFTVPALQKLALGKVAWPELQVTP